MLQQCRPNTDRTLSTSLETGRRTSVLYVHDRSAAFVS
jgi:hypothetical protein